MTAKLTFIVLIILYVSIICTESLVNENVAHGFNNIINGAKSDREDSNVTLLHVEKHNTNDLMLVEGTEMQNGHNNDTEDKRYHVASFSWEHVQAPYIISLWILFASLCKTAFHLSKKLPLVFPESCMLVLLGITVGIVFFFSSQSREQFYTMSSDTFFLYLLPPIVLDAGYFMPTRAFFDNIGTILLFAVIGTLFNAFAVGFSLFGLSVAGVFGIKIELLHCLLFGSLISAVDPVAVLAVFEEVHVNEILHIIVFGESLLNDAVTVVLYHMFEAYVEIGKEKILAVDIIAGVCSFFVVGLGGTLIGVLFGFTTGFITRFTQHLRVIEPIYVFLMGYMSYLTAEMFHLSGIMAATFCGISMRQYVEANVSQKSHTTIKYWLKMLSSCSETIIFMFLGMSTVTKNHEWNTWFVLFTLVFCFVYRALGVVTFTFGANKIRLNRLNKVEQFIMAYGGIRGAVSFSLVILLNVHLISQEMKEIFTTATIAVVFVTIFIQGITIKPLVQILDVKRADKHKPSMNEEIQSRFMDHIMAGIEDIAGHHGHHYLRDMFDYYDLKYLSPLLMRDPPKVRNQKIVETFTKLSLKDAMDHLARHGTFTSLDDASLSKIIRNYSSSGLSNQVDIDGLAHEDSNPAIDMMTLDARYTRKHADDAKMHHMLTDSMFAPRKRHKTYERHTLQEVENHPPFHHHYRHNLRHVFYAHDKKHRKASSVSAPEKKKKKSVNHLTVEEISPTSSFHRHVSFIDGLAPAKEYIEPPPKPSSITSSDDDEDRGGITFRAKPSSMGSMDDLPLSCPSPTAAETVLPWRKSDQRGPASPVKAETPTWADNYIVTASPESSPAKIKYPPQQITVTPPNEPQKTHRVGVFEPPPYAKQLSAETVDGLGDPGVLPDRPGMRQSYQSAVKNEPLPTFHDDEDELSVDSPSHILLHPGDRKGYGANIGCGADSSDDDHYFDFMKQQAGDDHDTQSASHLIAEGDSKRSLEAGNDNFHDKFSSSGYVDSPHTFNSSSTGDPKDSKLLQPVDEQTFSKYNEGYQSSPPDSDIIIEMNDNNDMNVNLLDGQGDKTRNESLV